MAAELLPIEREGAGRFAGMVTVRLEQPGRPVVVLDRGLFERLEATLRQLEREAAAIRGLVLASASERAFVAGADLRTIAESSDDDLRRYLEYGARVMGMICLLPFPSVAAINGAALGGGLELAMHCDGLVACPSASGKPYAVGLPETGLGLCPGWGGTNLFPARIEPAEAIRRTATGKLLTYDEAVSLGMFDRVAPAVDGLVTTCGEWLVEASARRRERSEAPSRWIGRPDRAPAALRALDQVKGDLAGAEPARAVAECVNAGLTGGWSAALATERASLVRLRGRPESKAAIEAFFARSAPKS